MKDIDAFLSAVPYYYNLEIAVPGASFVREMKRREINLSEKVSSL